MIEKYETEIQCQLANEANLQCASEQVLQDTRQPQESQQLTLNPLCDLLAKCKQKTLHHMLQKL